MEKTQTELKYDEYDKVITTIMQNILVERKREEKYIIYGFNPNDNGNRLFFNVTAVAADLAYENIYLNMPLWDYLKFWIKRRKKRSNLRWFGNYKIKNRTEQPVSATFLMSYIAQALSVSYDFFREINDEYYGWFE